MADLPLFAWQPPRQMIPFPADKRIGKARRCAEVIASRQTKRARDAYWRQTTETLADQLFRAGIEEAEIERQIGLFREAVQRELDRLSTDEAASR